MKLQPQPLAWIAALGTAIFIAAGSMPVTAKFEAKSIPDNCGSPFNDLGQNLRSCQGSHVTAIIVMVLTAAVAVVCLIILARLTLPAALGEADTRLPVRADPVKTAASPPSAPRPAAPASTGPPVGWYLDPKDSTVLRWWNGDKFSDITKPRDP